MKGVPGYLSCDISDFRPRGGQGGGLEAQRALGVEENEYKKRRRVAKEEGKRAARRRGIPTGGAANGTPRKDAMSSEMLPRMGPAVVVTVGVGVEERGGGRGRARQHADRARTPAR